MNVDYPTDEIPATPEYVLELFREATKEPDDPNESITFDTTVSEFTMLWNDSILFWWELAKPLNEFTRLRLPIQEWKSVLTPKRQRKLRDVCEFVSSRMGTRRAIRPWRHIGGDCLPAGAFLTTRGILARHGADARTITPSTELEPYLKKYGFSWLSDLYRLAPGRIPPLAIAQWFPTIGCLLGLAVGVGLILLGKILGKGGEQFWAIGFLILFVTALVSWTVHALSRKKYSLGDLLTFRDLAYALAGQQPRRRIQPSS